MLIAQITDKAIEEMGKAAGTAAANAPTNWIQAAVSAFGFIAFCWIVRQFMQAQQGDRAERADFREALQAVTESSAELHRESQRSCHSHSQSVIDSAKQHAQILADAAKEIGRSVDSIEHVAKENRNLVHDARGILAEQRTLIDIAMMQLGKPTINQLINPQVEAKERGE